MGCQTFMRPLRNLTYKCRSLKDSLTVEHSRKPTPIQKSILDNWKRRRSRWAWILEDWEQQYYTKYDIWCHLIDIIMQQYICLMCISFFYQQRSKWLFGHYRTFTHLLGKNTSIINIYRIAKLGIVSDTKYDIQCSWHIRTLPHQILSTLDHVCPHSHQNLVGEWLAWNLALHGPKLNISIG